MGTKRMTPASELSPSKKIVSSGLGAEPLEPLDGPFVTARGGPAEPADALLQVLCDAPAVFVHLTHMYVFSVAVVLFGDLAKPAQGLGIVLGHAPALAVHVAEVVHGVDVALLERAGTISPPR